MFHFVLSAAFMAYVHASMLSRVPKLDDRIVGEVPINITEAPWHVALLQNNHDGTFGHLCSGSILSSRHIVTAAHCTDGTVASDWRVRAGSSWHNQSGQVVNVESIVQHERFTLHDSDISLLKLATPLEYSPSVQPIELPEQGQDFAEGTESLVTGWTLVTEHDVQLQKVLLPVINQELCQEANAGVGNVTLNMICAGSLKEAMHACNADTGGPMIIEMGKKLLVGITSWGGGCGEKIFPLVFTRVSQFKSWILEHINNTTRV